MIFVGILRKYQLCGPRYLIGSSRVKNRYMCVKCECVASGASLIALVCYLKYENMHVIMNSIIENTCKLNWIVDFITVIGCDIS